MKIVFYVHYLRIEDFKAGKEVQVCEKPHPDSFQIEAELDEIEVSSHPRNTIASQPSVKKIVTSK